MWSSFKSVTVTDLLKACATRMNRFTVDRRRRLIIHCGSGETSRTPNPGRLLNPSNPLAHTNIPPRYAHPQMPRCTICSHPQAAAITASLDLIGTRKTARQFHVSLPAVNRHKQHVREERDAQ